METAFESLYCKGKIQKVNNDITVIGILNDHVKNRKIKYIAACPADYRSTWTGSGLPFKDQEQAFDNSPNIGEISLNFDNEFKIQLMLPNSYAVGLGSIIIPPTLYIMYVDEEDKHKKITIKLSHGIPYRHLTYPMERKGPEFYATQFKLFPKSQWIQAIESSYPKVNQQYPDYYGARPPL